MYKTIRHGENSLQYTILPQHDDYSKGGGGGGGGGGAGGSAATSASGSAASLMPDSLGHHGASSVGGVKIVRNKRRSWMAYVGLFFVCSIITGAILVPLLVSVEVLSGPKDWFYRHTGHGGTIVSNNRKSTSSRLMSSSAASSSAAFRHDVYDRVNRTESTTTPQMTPVGEDALEKENAIERNPPLVENQSRLLAMLTSSTPSADAALSAEAVEPSIYIEDPIQILPTDEYSISKIVPVTPTYLDFPATTTSTTSTKTKPTGPIMVNPGRKLRKPKVSRPNSAIPAPTLYPATSVVTDPSSAAGILIVGASMASPTRTWIDSHWPIVDSSTYFKWTSYKPEDNILLPVIICTAVTVVILCLICMMLRKTCSMCRKKRVSLLTVEAQNGDNTTLLTNEEEEEDLSEDE